MFMSDKKTIGEEIAEKNNEGCARRRIAFDQVMEILVGMDPGDRGIVIRTVAAFYGQELSR